jgi:hypothetical protein
LDATAEIFAAELDGVPGALQRYVEGSSLHEQNVNPQQVDWESVHAVAVLQFITRMDDPYTTNVVAEPTANGRFRLQSIDHEYTFGDWGYPATWRWPAAAQDLIRKTANAPKQLSERTWTRLKNVDITRWRAALLAEGISESEADGAIERLRQVQEHGLLAIMPELRW